MTSGFKFFISLITSMLTSLFALPVLSFPFCETPIHIFAHFYIISYLLEFLISFRYWCLVLAFAITFFPWVAYLFILLVMFILEWKSLFILLKYLYISGGNLFFICIELEICSRGPEN